MNDLILGFDYHEDTSDDDHMINRKEHVKRDSFSFCLEPTWHRLNDLFPHSLCIWGFFLQKSVCGEICRVHQQCLFECHIWKIFYTDTNLEQLFHYHNSHKQQSWDAVLHKQSNQVTIWHNLYLHQPSTYSIWHGRAVNSTNISGLGELDYRIFDSCHK